MGRAGVVSDGELPPHLAAEVDQAMDRMIRAPHVAGEHQCPYCPVSVRSLYAVAYNAMLALDMARAGMGDWERAWRKVGEMRETVLALEPLVAAHFKALGMESL